MTYEHKMFNLRPVHKYYSCFCHCYFQREKEREREKRGRRKRERERERERGNIKVNNHHSKEHASR
jgi:hypothetical protein